MASRLKTPLRRLWQPLQSQPVRLPKGTILQAARPFTTTPAIYKKRKIAAPANSPVRKDEPTSSSKDGAASGAADEIDPLDFTPLTSTFPGIDVHFKTQLQALLHGGRFNPDQLGTLNVTVKSVVPADDMSGTKVTKVEDFPLRELCQVVPRGRTLSLLVNDKEYIKPILSAIQASPDFNQQPQRSDENDLELILKVEMERKEDVIKRVKDLTQTWRERVRHARGKHEKLMKEWKRKGAIRADQLRKAENELQKVQNKKMKEIDDDEARAVKQLGRN